MQNSPNRRLLVKLLGGAVCMFLFALFVMPPLYNMFCAQCSSPLQPTCVFISFDVFFLFFFLFLALACATTEEDESSSSDHPTRRVQTVSPKARQGPDRLTTNSST